MAVTLSSNLFNPTLIRRDVFFTTTTRYEERYFGGFITSGIQKIPSGRTIRISQLQSYSEKYIRFLDANKNYLTIGSFKTKTGVQLQNELQVITPPLIAEFIEFTIQVPGESVVVENVYLGTVTTISFPDPSVTTPINTVATPDLKQSLDTIMALITNAVNPSSSTPPSSTGDTTIDNGDNLNSLLPDFAIAYELYKQS